MRPVAALFDVLVQQLANKNPTKIVARTPEPTTEGWSGQVVVEGCRFCFRPSTDRRVGQFFTRTKWMITFGSNLLAFGWSYWPPPCLVVSTAGPGMF